VGTVFRITIDRTNIGRRLGTDRTPRGTPLRCVRVRDEFKKHDLNPEGRGVISFVMKLARFSYYFSRYRTPPYVVTVSRFEGRCVHARKCSEEYRRYSPR